tara:strand:+ start:273 stop:1472 length:1200 start_codon:yes stop_codon:yes gene_type:complete
VIKKITNISKIITFNNISNNLEIIENKEILVKNGKIIEIANNCQDCNDIIDANNNIVTPGFIDSHTHPIFVGERSKEFFMRINGKNYNEISKSGGGILSTVEKLRSASDDELYEISLENILPFINNGTTTMEAKSGYGLSTKDEIRSLEIINKLNKSLKIDIIPTFLGAHAIPQGYNKSDYIKLICDEMIPEIAKRKLAVFCDVFCENGYFDTDDSMQILNTAKEYGMVPRMHIDEFQSIGGAFIANKVNAASADHLMAIDDPSIKSLANSNVIATLLPGTTFMLNKNKYANGRKLIDSGCNVALATDFNPGTCTIRSLTQIMLLAILNCGMSIEECFKAVTCNAAKSLLLMNEIGLIKENYKADLLFWNIDSLDELVYWSDSSVVKLKKIMKNGDFIN